MRIAIIGGGASGLAAAYFLRKQHNVHLFERASNLGGHVRTLGQNVHVDNLPAGGIAENGPIGFHVATSPTFLSLLKELGITTESAALGTNLLLANQIYSLPPDLKNGRRRFFGAGTGGWRTGVSLLHFVFKTRHSWMKHHTDTPIGDVFPEQPFLRDWLRCMLMMGLSTPIEVVDSLPVSFAASTLRQGLMHAEWKYIPGGVHSYQAELLSRMDGQVFLNSPVDKIFRDDNGVKLSVRGQLTHTYDHLIVATPPGRVLSMLDRPSLSEAKFFSKWADDRPFRTIAHSDLAMYENKDVDCPSTADYFQRDDGDFGYNCCVSRLYSRTDEFSFAYKLDHLIDPAKRLESHEHRIPAYSHEALLHREEFIHTNGANHIFYTGAYLGNGLHEGAVSTANRAANLLQTQIM